MANKTVSLQLPTELVEAIEAQAQARGQSRTDIVIAALSKFCGWQHSLPQSVTIEQLRQQLNEIKYQIAILSECNKPELRLTNTEQNSLLRHLKWSQLLGVAEQN